jgi:hypothetical protein
MKYIILAILFALNMQAQLVVNKSHYYGDPLNNTAMSIAKNRNNIWFVSTSEKSGTNQFVLNKIKTNLDTVFTKQITLGNIHYNPKIQFYKDTIYVAGYVNISGLLDLEVIKLDTLGNVLQSVYFGGSSSDILESFVIDKAGDLVLGGKTVSLDFPCLGNSYQSTSTGPMDACIVKMNKNLVVIWSTYLGGSGYDDSHTLTVDSAKNIYIAGNTLSPIFPTTAGAYQTGLSGGLDTYITKFSSAGNLLHSTYLGGTSTDEILSLNFDGNILYAAGYTSSNNFPGLTSVNAQDAIIVKLDTALNFITTMNVGGSGQDFFNNISILNHKLLIVGETSSPDIIQINGVQPSFSGSNDILIAILDSNFNKFTISYLGGTDYDGAFGSVYLDSIYILARTQSSPFPYQNNTSFGDYDNVVIKLTSAVYNFILEQSIPNVLIFPNPTTDAVYFSQEIKTIELYNYSGALIKRYSNKDRINIEDLSNGIYLLKLNGANYKIVKY